MRTTNALLAGMIFWGVVVGGVLHVSGYFRHPNLAASLGTSVLVSIFCTLGMIATFKPKFEGRPGRAFLSPLLAFAILFLWGGCLRLMIQ